MESYTNNKAELFFSLLDGYQTGVMLHHHCVNYTSSMKKFKNLRPKNALEFKIFFFFCSQKSEIIEEHLKHQQLLLDRPGSRASSTYQRSLSGFSDRRYEDVLLRSPLTASCR